MSPEDLLRELEACVGSLPEAVQHHDPAAADDAMSDWIRAQEGPRQRAVLTALPTLLRDHVHPWHDHAALEIAVRLRENSLLDAAVAEAERLGPADERSSSPTHELLFQLHVVGSIYALPTGAGRRYLEALRSGSADARGDARRELCIRAWVTLCVLEQHGSERCLTEAIVQLRAWDSDRVRRSAMGLIGAYFRGDEAMKDVLRPLLSPIEAKEAML